MKKEYETPLLEIYLLDEADFIMTSGEGNLLNDGSNDGEWNFLNK